MAEKNSNIAQNFRRYDIDWLRVVSVLLLIPFHGALIYSLNPDYVVYIKAKIESPFLVTSALTLGNFHMPLLFVLAGMSIYYSLRKRSIKAFLIERVKKLFVPILVSVFVWNQLTTYLYRVHSGETVTLGEHYLHMFSMPIADATGRNGCFTVIHLWFATFLFIFSFVLLPFFIWLKKEDNVWRGRLASFFEKPYALALFVLPLTACYSVDILGDKNPLAYLLIVALGFMLATDERYQKAIDRDKWGYLLYSVISIAVCLIWNIDNAYSERVGFLKLMFSISRRIIPVYALLGIGHCYFNKTNAVLPYLSRSSFTIYVTHMLVQTVAAYFIVNESMPIVLQWSLICIVTYLVSFLCYELIKRNKFFSFLFGVVPVTSKRKQAERVEV